MATNSVNTQNAISSFYKVNNKELIGRYAKTQNNNIL